MPEMLHNEAGERLVEGIRAETECVYDSGSIRGIGALGIQSLAKQKRETGSMALRTSQRGRKSKMTEEDLQRLKAEIESHPDKTLGGAKRRIEAAVQRIKIKPNRLGKAGIPA